MATDSAIGLKGILVPVFKGDEASFREWRRKFKAYVSVILRKPQWVGDASKLSQEEKGEFYSILVLTLDGDAQRFVSRRESTRDGTEVWKALTEYYEEATIVAQVSLEEEFYRFKMKEDEDPGKFLLEVDDYFQRYDRITGTVTENDKRLPKAISRMTGRWRMIAAEKLNKDSTVEGFAKVLARIFKMGCSGRNDGVQEEALMVERRGVPKGGKFNGRCFNCGQKGHRKEQCQNERKIICFACGAEGHRSSECTKKCEFCNKPGHNKFKCLERKKAILDLDNVMRVNNTSNTNQDSQYGTGCTDSVSMNVCCEAGENTRAVLECMSVGETKGDMVFCMDSGCSKWMVPNKDILKNYRRTSSEVVIGDGRRIQAQGEGDMNMVLEDEAGRAVDVNVRRVLHVPELDRKLASVHMITENGNKVVFEKGLSYLELENGSRVKLERMAEVGKGWR